MKQKIEKAAFLDLPEIAVLQKLAFYEVGRFYRNFRIRPLLATLADLESTFGEYVYYKAVDGGRIIGSARAKETGNVCEIENVIVHPSFQGRGIGTILIERIESDFPLVLGFELFTGKDSPGNVAFYEKLGFRIVEEKAATDLEPVLVIMKKKNNRTIA